MNIPQIIENSLYFLALINPVSKVLFIASKTPAYSRKNLLAISMQSSAAALLILVLLASVGDFLLLKVFHVEIYSLSVAGGVILFITGIRAVSTGSFFEKNKNKSREKITDIAIVPLATPMIAGPGSMAAVISAASIYGVIATIVCVTIAITINFLCMIYSGAITAVTEKLKITDALIRITGLIVTSVAMQMIFSGCTAWVKSL